MLHLPPRHSLTRLLPSGRPQQVFTLGCLNELDWTGVVAAGGCVLGCLLPMATRFASDDASRLYYLGKAITLDEDGETAVAGRSLDCHISSETGHAFPWDINGDRELGSLMNDTSGFEASDIDLFLVGLSHEEALTKLRHIHATLKAAWGANEVSRAHRFLARPIACLFAKAVPLERPPVCCLR